MDVSWWSDLGHDVAALVWPTACLGCGRPDRELCVPCAAALIRDSNPVAVDTVGHPGYVSGEYAGLRRALITALKHEHRVRMARPLARVLGPLLAAGRLHRRRPVAGAAPRLLLVPAPTRRAAVRARGFRHLDLIIAQAVRDVRGVFEVGHPLRATRRRRSQVGLSAHERAENAARVAIRRSWKRRIEGREVILVDDVITTGATLREAAAALERGGAHVLAVVALCEARRRGT